jgi:hypothetical protein
VNGLVLVVGVTVGVLVCTGFTGLIRPKQSDVLVRVERQMAGLRTDVDGVRAAQEHLAASLERRMDDLEQTTAHAANEVRMVSNEVMSRLHAVPDASTSGNP